MRWLLLLILLSACRAQGLPPDYALLAEGQTEALRQVALGGEGYARLLAGWRLVAREEVPLAERAEYAWRYALFLEEARAFEPGWEAREAWRVAAFLLEAAGDGRAFSAWARLLPEEEAAQALLRLGTGERLWEALFQGRAYEVLLEVLPQGERPDLRAQALYRLGRYGEALPHYRAWAEKDPRGFLGLGYALWRRPEDWPALVPLLYRLGAYREGIRAAWPTALAYPRAYREWVEAYAREEGLDPDLLFALLHVESRFDPLARSPTGALGLAQFLRSTWADVARMLGEPPADPFDPQSAIRYAARYLRWLLERCAAFSGVEGLACALTAYNGGIGYTLRGIAREGGLYAFLRFQERDEPREYLAKVLSAYAAYKAIP
nr:transglycosylase SLT domain-containing protein [Thermus composti]